MTTPSVGPIAFSDINTELGRASNTAMSLNDADVRALAGAPFSTPGTAISLNDLRGKSSAIPISYYPTSNPAAVTTATDVTGFTISTAGEYIMTVSAPFNAPFIMWGAGGSRGNDNVSGGGGAGGSASGTLSLSPGTTYRIVVGGSSAQTQFASPFGSGGPGGGPDAFGGAGGGYTALFVGSISQPTTRLMAGGGGGGNGTDAGNQPAATSGGAGGGPSGQSANTPQGGAGGAQTIPASFTGGTGATRGIDQGSGGGGGGGFNGGGGGNNIGSGTAGQSGHGGGGGSGYIHPSVVGGSTVGGNRTTTGNAPSPYRGTAGNPGTIGRFVMLPKT